MTHYMSAHAAGTADPLVRTMRTATMYQSGNAYGGNDPLVWQPNSMPSYDSGATGDALLRSLRTQTVYDSANAATPRHRVVRALRRNVDLLTNSGSLMATTIVTSALGFVY